jgi:hypothetical protein
LVVVLAGPDPPSCSLVSRAVNTHVTAGEAEIAFRTFCSHKDVYNNTSTTTTTTRTKTQETCV